MPACENCGHKQNKLNSGNLCKSCFAIKVDNNNPIININKSADMSNRECKQCY